MKISNYLQIVFSFGFFCFSTSGIADSASNNDQHLPEVACCYEMKMVSHAKSKAKALSNIAWFFWRKSGMIQTQDVDGDYGELWERTAGP